MCNASNRAVLLAATALACWTAQGSSARAQDAAGPGAVEEVVVTAQRREERLQDVPISLSALSGDELERRRVDNIQDILGAIPSVAFTTTGGNEARTDISVRGVANQGGVTSPFAVYVDEVSIVFSGVGLDLGSVRGLDLNLLDIERAEVLRGPQGTYFGRNAIGGAINVLTRKPGGSPGGYLSADAGLEGASGLNGRTLLVRGAVAMPLSDTFGVRMNAYVEDAEGWLRDLGPAGNTNDRNAYGVRVAARWTPSDRVTVDLTASHSSRDRGINTDLPTGQGLLGLACSVDPSTNATFCPLGALSIPVAPIDSGQGFWPQNRSRIATNTPAKGANRTTMVTGAVAYDLDAATLTVVGGWIRNRAYDGGDLDLSPLDYLGSERTNTARGENYSIEARLASAGGETDPLRWTVGVNAAHELGGRGIVAYWGAAAEVPPPFRGLLFAAYDAEVRTRSAAVFGELTYRLTDALAATVGLRYSNDEVKTTSFSATESLGPGLNVAPFSVEHSFRDWSPKATLTYRWSPDVMTYATVSKGYKAGGFNPGLGATAANSPSYAPEVLWNYEVGVKSEFWDRRARLNVAAYYMDWRDIQVSIFDSQTISNLVRNAAAGSIKGAEVELVARPGVRTTVTAAYSYNDAKYDDFENCFTIQTTAGPPISIDCSGRRFGTKHNVNVSLEQRFSVHGFQAYLRGEYSWRSKLWKIDDIQETTDPRSRPFTIDAYGTVNLRLGVEHAQWRAEIYGENLVGDVPAIGDRELFSFITGEQATPLPRAFGIRVRRDF